jgi:hypothetical protein
MLEILNDLQNQLQLHGGKEASLDVIRVTPAGMNAIARSLNIEKPDKVTELRTILTGGIEVVITCKH